MREKIRDYNKNGVSEECRARTIEVRSPGSIRT